MCECKDGGIGSGVLLDKLEITSEKRSERHLRKRAIAKAISNEIARKLELTNSPLTEQYIKSRWCSFHIKVYPDGTKTTFRCRKRWCRVCDNIRQAEMINSYEPAFEGMAEPFYVTLTEPAVKAKDLQETVRKQIKTFTRIKDILRKKGIALDGVRKAESNYNPTADTYNPHLHIIVDGEIEAQAIVYYWLKKNPTAEHYAQNIQPADKGTLKELLKYNTKALTGKGNDKGFHPHAMDTINLAFRGVRTFQPYGSIRKAQKEQQEAPKTSETIKDGINHAPDPDSARESSTEAVTYLWNENNWYSLDGEPLVQIVFEKKHLRVLEMIKKAHVKWWYRLE